MQGNSVRLSRPVGTTEPYTMKATSRNLIQVNGRPVYIGNMPAAAIAQTEGVPHFHLPGEPCPLVKESK